MFYPFNAAMAANATTEATNKNDVENEVLLAAYIQIAHVHISRAASRGYHGAASYCPLYLREQFMKTLNESGFTTEKISGSSMIRICW